ncbi:unnamed protein product [[Actinomadura] parvosata subsp. kistnae]|nr:unnamed protein product [Actinomadura parvosata subsp. kistnae]
MSPRPACPDVQAAVAMRGEPSARAAISARWRRDGDRAVRSLMSVLPSSSWAKRKQITWD